MENIIDLICQRCNIETKVLIPFGAYLDINDGAEEKRNVDVAVYQEHRGLPDKHIVDVSCQKCGCCSFLKLK